MHVDGFVDGCIPPIYRLLEYASCTNDNFRQVYIVCVTVHSALKQCVEPLWTPLCVTQATDASRLEEVSAGDNAYSLSATPPLGIRTNLLAVSQTQLLIALEKTLVCFQTTEQKLLYSPT